MKIVEQCNHEYVKVSNMFKRSCCMTDLASSTRSTIEECIIGLKEVMINDDGKCALKVICELGYNLGQKFIGRHTLAQFFHSLLPTVTSYARFLATPLSPLSMLVSNVLIY